MYAIRNKKTKKWVSGTDFRSRHYRKHLKLFYHDNAIEFPREKSWSYSQFTSLEKALTFESYREAFLAFKARRCGYDYEIVEVNISEIHRNSEQIKFDI